MKDLMESYNKARLDRLMNGGDDQAPMEEFFLSAFEYSLPFELSTGIALLQIEEGRINLDGKLVIGELFSDPESLPFYDAKIASNSMGREKADLINSSCYRLFENIRQEIRILKRSCFS